MNQGDHIRNMTNDDLASLFVALGCCPDSISRYVCMEDDACEDCQMCWLRFLKTEYKGEQND